MTTQQDNRFYRQKNQVPVDTLDRAADTLAENAHLRAVNAELVAALRATLNPLVLLGDYIGNEYRADGDAFIEPFDRCAIIGQVKDALARAEGGK